MTDTTYWAQAVIGGTTVDLMSQATAVGLITEHVRDADATAPLAVVSANLDHVHHFGTGGLWSGTIGTPSMADAAARRGNQVVWLNLLDGAPLVDRARALTGMRYPRLAGSDLIDPLLAEAERRRLSIGFVGGTAAAQRDLRHVLKTRMPDLQLVGTWAPDRSDLTSPTEMARLTRDIRAARVDVLVVGLGKPRQELWIAEHGAATGARVFLAFGAVVDFLAGRVARANPWIREHGLEWAWRLSREPRRLANRYLVQGPSALVTTRTTGAVMLPHRQDAPHSPVPHASGLDRFAGRDEHVDIVVLTVTYNSVDDVEHLIKSLRAELDDVTLRLVVADNGSIDGTLEHVQLHEDVIAFGTGGNLGYAGGINCAYNAAGPADAYLVLNPDLTVEPGALKSMLCRLHSDGVGAVVPRLLNRDGSIYKSLRREPTVARAYFDAIFGARWPNRPPKLSEYDQTDESYAHPHPVDWATGAALLVRADVAAQVGKWDERYFMYSEETDYCRRVRETGATIWYEPAARMTHLGGGSSRDHRLFPLMAVNRVRYAQANMQAMPTHAIRVAGLIREALRATDVQHRRAFTALLRPSTCDVRPKDQFNEHCSDTIDLSKPITGTIIIPAHNEADLIARTLTPLVQLVNDRNLEIIVVCNGCTDDTAHIAKRFAGVTVIELAKRSKVAAINAGDRIATKWPRLYLDADVRVTPTTVRDLFSCLGRGDALAARPTIRYDADNASALVASYYRARARIANHSQSLWGAGAYAVSAAGHVLFTEFPDVISDDLWIDGIFHERDKAVVSTTPALVSTPRRTRHLIGTLRRVYRGNSQLRRLVTDKPAQTTRTTITHLATSISDLQSALDTAVYALFAVLGRASLDRNTTRWERDPTSRTTVI